MRGTCGLALLIATAFAIAARASSSLEDTFWPKSLPAQGPPPSHWSDLEKSLSPDACGQCHAEQLAQWQSSRHAHAMSPGVLGQLLDLSTSDAAECLQCHAPLAEQRTAFEQARARGTGHRIDQLGLAAAGNACGGCHLRANRRFGPPPRGTGAPGARAAHDGATRTDYFEKSEFCMRCHQFPADRAVNGKPLENTYAEWQASPQAAQGITCQTCHMPDRRHLWRGIHDPDTVRAGLTVRTIAGERGARFEITNSGVGHAFPTYVTPKVVMHAVALDQAGVPQTDTARMKIIARRVRYRQDTWSEISDSRLLPMRTASLEIPWQNFERIRVWLEIIPDDYYATEVFPTLLRDGSVSLESSHLIARAAADAASSGYVLFRTDLRRPR